MIFLRRMGLICMLLLTGCMTEAPAEPQFVVTPEPGVPAFQAATAEATSGTGYPATGVAGTAGAETTGYPGAAAASGNSVDGRSQTALESYELAEQTAKKDYSQDAELYAIVPSEIMIANLGGPPVLPGWFYKFKTPGSRREFIVQVVDETITGTTTAESLAETEPAELQLDLSDVKLDSPAVLEQFKKVAAERNLETEGKIYDLELVNPEGKGGPIWSVVDPATKQWLYSVSAANGSEVPNPHQ